VTLVPTALATSILRDAGTGDHIGSPLPAVRHVLHQDVVIGYDSRTVSRSSTAAGRRAVMIVVAPSWRNWQGQLVWTSREVAMAMVA